MRRLTTLTGNAFLVLGTLVLGLLAVPVSLLPRGTHLVFAMSKAWSWGLLAASGVRMKVRFASRLDPKRSYIFIANHQSMFDIPVVISTVPVQMRFAAKRSLFKIPVFGWAIRAGGLIPVDPGSDRRQAMATLNALQERLTDGISVLLFPEGSRSLDGLLHPFERGGFLLALKTGLPIVPVGIRGTLGVQMRGKKTIHGGPVEVRYGEPIDPAAYGVRGRGELLGAGRGKIAELAGTEVTEEPIPVDEDEVAPAPLRGEAEEAKRQ
jgi:1-acyl-sn-glycerol-3-phosphate acyltransferase